LEDQVRVQKMFCDSRVTIRNTGQQNHPPNHATVCVLLMAKERAWIISMQMGCEPVHGALFCGIAHKHKFVHHPLCEYCVS
jgi:predicted nucleic acid-binding protein